MPPLVAGARPGERKGKTMYYDNDGRTVVTTEQLRQEWLWMMQEGMIDEMSFSDFLLNSMASNGGSLERM